MALSATIIKADVQVSDLNQHHYQQHTLTLAQHPSETNERLMVRLLAFTMFAYQEPEFTKGLSATDEADIWQKDLSGQIIHWISLGQPSADFVKKACNQSQQVSVICYGDNAPDSWWQKNQSALEKQKKLSVYRLSQANCQALEQLHQLKLELNITIEGDDIMLSDTDNMLQLNLDKFK